jgi:hypothetical protein
MAVGAIIRGAARVNKASPGHQTSAHVTLSAPPNWRQAALEDKRRRSGEQQCRNGYHHVSIRKIFAFVGKRPPADTQQAAVRFGDHHRKIMR